MSCPTCQHTMHNLGLDSPGRRVFLCPRCGTTKVDDPPRDDGSTEPPWFDSYTPRWASLALNDPGELAKEVATVKERREKAAALLAAAAAIESAGAEHPNAIRTVMVPGGPRIETGVIEFDYVHREGNTAVDWPGVFIRGDTAFGYLINLLALLDGAVPADDFITRHGLLDLARLLDASNTNDDIRRFDAAGNRRPPPKWKPLPVWRELRVVAWMVERADGSGRTEERPVESFTAEERAAMLKACNLESETAPGRVRP